MTVVSYISWYCLCPKKNNLSSCVFILITLDVNCLYPFFYQPFFCFMQMCFPVWRFTVLVQIAKLLEWKEANHIELCRIKNVLDEILHMYRNSELNEILEHLIGPTWVATGLEIDFKTLVSPKTTIFFLSLCFHQTENTLYSIYITIKWVKFTRLFYPRFIFSKSIFFSMRIYTKRMYNKNNQFNR
jgi:hypothetical protein